MKLLQQCFLFFIVVVIPGHNLGNSQVSVNRTIGPTLVYLILVIVEETHYAIKAGIRNAAHDSLCHTKSTSPNLIEIGFQNLKIHIPMVSYSALNDEKNAYLTVEYW